MLSDEKVDTPWTVGGRRPGKDPSYHGSHLKDEAGSGEAGPQEGGPLGMSKKEARRLRKEQRKKEVRGWSLLKGVACGICGATC